jgi:hypothetical protein
MDLFCTEIGECLAIGRILYGSSFFLLCSMFSFFESEVILDAGYVFGLFVGDIIKIQQIKPIVYYYYA